MYENGANQEYQVQTITADSSSDEDVGRKGIRESFERIYRREDTSRKAQKKMGWIKTMDKDARRMLTCRNWRRLANVTDVWRRRI
jgi:hypothetical protein